MALSANAYIGKFRRGPDNRLSTIKAKDGQIIFTPDTGSLYIDIAGDGTTTPVVAKSTTANSGANRIRIGGPADGLVYSFTVNGIRFDGSQDKDAGTIKTTYGGTGNTSFTANRLIFSETATKLSSASNIYVTHSGIAINADHITSGYVFEVSGDSRFFGATTTTGVATFNGNVVMNSSATADSLSAGSLVVSGNSSLVNTATTAALLPHANNTYDIGSSSLKYKNIYGALKGNADTATEFAETTTVALTGVVTGTSAASKRGWSISTSIGNGKITNAMLAGSITNDRLKNPYIQIIGQQVDLGENIDLSTMLSLLGLSTSMRYVGKATVAITDGGTQNPTISGYTWPDDRRTGDVVIDSSENAEYVWALTGKWEKLGPEASYKVVQTPLGQTSGTINKWVSAIHQDANGNLDTIQYMDLDTSGEWSGNAATATKATQDASGNVITSTYVKKSDATATDPSANGTSLTFIATITQTNGKISATKKTVQSATDAQAGVVSTSEQTFGGQKTFKNKVIISDTGDSTYRTDVAAALRVAGGLSVAKQTSVQKLMIDDHVQLEYDSSTNSLQFVFA